MHWGVGLFYEGEVPRVENGHVDDYEYWEEVTWTLTFADDILEIVISHACGLESGNGISHVYAEGNEICLVF